MYRFFHLALGLDGDEPFLAITAHGDACRLALYPAAVAIAKPAYLGQKQPVVVLLDPELLGIG